MHYYILSCGINHFCRCFLQAFITEEILKLHVKDCFKINSKQRIKFPKISEHVKFKNFKRKIKLPFIIYAGFENILVPKDNGKQITEDTYANKYQKHVACSYG